MRPIIAAFLVLLAPAARAATIFGTSFTTGALIPSNNDILSGTFQNVTQFSVGVGTTVKVAPGVTLAIYAATVTIRGTLDASGAGQAGGLGGPPSNGTGQTGNSGDPLGTAGGGVGAAADLGAGGGSFAAAGGVGAGAGGSAAGAVYGSTGVYVSFPLSAANAIQGSGGGGGGANTTLNGGQGGNGGGAIYIEAGSMTVTGSILASGTTAANVSEGNAGTHPGGGGGGSGGTILLRIPGSIDVSGAVRIGADGGKGGNVDASGGTVEPGGGGGGGRVEIFAAQAAYGAIISTAAGPAGSKDTGFFGSVDGVNPPGAGSVGVSTFGTVASPPSNPGVAGTTANSITWSWTATPSFGNGATPSQYQYRLFSSTSAPMPSPAATSAVVGTTESGLNPDTTYYRVITAYTDWGDSLPTGFISTHTLASAPVAAAFANVYSSSITVNWTASNQAYTKYEVNRALDTNFGVGVTTTNPLVAVSSTPLNLTPNTKYFFRARAVNCDNVPTAYTAVMTTATLGAIPASPQFGQVFVTSASYVWSANGNPAGTTYLVQVSSDNFFTLVDSSQTLNTSATFFTLTPNTQYFYRSFSINQLGAVSQASALIHGASGNLTDLTAPSAPGTPFADRQFSYDGTMTFMWAAAQSSVGILDYNLLIGGTAGGNDVFNGNVTVASASVSGLASGKSYFAEVRARANNGVIGPFSSISQGVPVFIPGGTAPIGKPYNWPNPFNPATGATQIGVNMDTAGSVVFKIFTLNGQLVHEQSVDLQAGNQVLSWSGASDSGRTVAPGGYIGVIEKHTNGGVSTQKFKMAVLY